MEALRSSQICSESDANLHPLSQMLRFHVIFPRMPRILLTFAQIFIQNIEFSIENNGKNQFCYWKNQFFTKNAPVELKSKKNMEFLILLWPPRVDKRFMSSTPKPIAQ